MMSEICRCAIVMKSSVTIIMCQLSPLPSQLYFCWHGGGDILCQGEDVTDGQAGHALPGLHGGAADVREDDDIRAGKQGTAGGQRLGAADIQTSSCTDIITMEAKEAKEITFNTASVEGGD